VSSPAARGGAAADGRLGHLLDESLVVAAFGAGDEEVEVRAVDPGATDVASLRQHDPAAAQAAGTALGRNGDLTFTPEARALLVEGRVDERVMTTLVAIADLRPVEVTDFPADPAEVAAGEARRAVVLRTDDIGGTTGIVRLVESQDDPYRPIEATVGEDGWIRVTWPIAALSAPPAS
jgi:hypothetical protein